MSRFEATIEEAPRGGALVTIPDDVIEALGGGGRIPVDATFDGVPYRGSIVRMGGRSILGVLKAIREELGKDHGDPLTVTVERDIAEREVTIPSELAAAFEDSPPAREAFGKLSYSHQREHVNHIIEAKKPETRERRAQRTTERLLGG